MSNRNLTRMPPSSVIAIIEDADVVRAAAIEHNQAFDGDVKRARALEQRFEVSGLVAQAQALRVPVPNDMALLKALNQIGVMPYDPDSVHAYMGVMLRSNMVNSTMFLVGVVLSIVGTIWGIVTIFPVGPTMATVIPGVVLGVGVALLFTEHRFVPFSKWGIFTPKDFTKRETGAWRQPVGGTIPLRIYELMERVVEAMPAATFTVVALVRERGTRPLFDIDPFLSVSHGSEQYYIAAWDEPGYGVRLLDAG